VINKNVLLSSNDFQNRKRASIFLNGLKEILFGAEKSTTIHSST